MPSTSDWLHVVPHFFLIRLLYSSLESAVTQQALLVLETEVTFLHCSN